MEAAMTRVAGFVLVLGCLSHVAPAQEAKTRAQQIQQQRAAIFKLPVEPDTDKVEQAIAWANERRLLTVFSAGWKGFTPTIGGMINGSGVAGGIQFLRPELWAEPSLFVRLGDCPQANISFTIWRSDCLGYSTNMHTLTSTRDIATIHKSRITDLDR